MTDNLAGTLPISWLKLPSLPYRAAFDLCAVEAVRVEGPIMLIACDRFQAREILKRVQSEVYLLTLGRWNPWQDDTRSELGPEIDWTRVQVLEAGEISHPVHLVVWIDPHLSDLESLQITLQDSLDAGGRLLVLTSGWLRALLPEWVQGGKTPVHIPASLYQTVRLLKSTGFRVLSVRGCQGPASLVWGFLGGLAVTAGRQDLLDRCMAAMRHRMYTQGPGAYLAPVAVLVAGRI